MALSDSRTFDDVPRHVHGSWSEEVADDLRSEKNVLLNLLQPD